MTQLETRRWTLTVKFDTLLLFVDEGDEPVEFERMVREHWDTGVPEDLHGLVVRDDRTVTLAADYMSYLEKPIQWLIGRTIPVSMTLVRNGFR